MLPRAALQSNDVIENELRFRGAAVTTPHALDQRNFGPDRRTASHRPRVGPDRPGGAGRAGRAQRHRQIDTVQGHPRRTADRDRLHLAAAALAHRQPRAGSAERARKPDRGGAASRRRTPHLADRGGDRARPASDRRNPDPPCRYRRTLRAGARGRDPQRPRFFHRGPGQALRRVFRRLADACCAGIDLVCRARSAAARRTDQLPRP